MASGKMFERPMPTRTNPPSATTTEGASAASSIPAQAMSPPPAITLVWPSRMESQVPLTRPAVMAKAYAAYPAAATAGVAWTSSVRCRVAQSAIAPSP